MTILTTIRHTVGWVLPTNPQSKDSDSLLNDHPDNPPDRDRRISRDGDRTPNDNHLPIGQNNADY